MMDIGDYYDRVEQRRKEAVKRLEIAKQKVHDHLTYENLLAVAKAEEDVIDAGNTGD